MQETTGANPRFRIVSFPTDRADAIRRALTDEAGNILKSRRDDEPHQCRSCLTLTKPGEPVLLVSHRPFESRQPYAESGPIFLHERSCVAYARDAYPPEFPHEAVVLRAYSPADEIVGAEYVGKRPVDDVIGGLFADNRVAYIHARNSTYGCFMFRIDRAN